MSSDASSIYQDWLDSVSEALLHGNVDVLEKFVSLPYLHRSLDNRTVIETHDDMVKGFKVFSESLQALGANQIVRLVSSAEYLSDDYINGTHVTHVMRNATPVVPSFFSQLTLRRCPTHWKLVENFGGYEHTSWPVRIMHVRDPDVKTASVHGTDARREAAQPLALYQRFLNALTRANVTGDIDAYAAMCCFPYTAHTMTEDQVIHTIDDLRPFFDNINSILEDNDIDSFARIADQAEFISGDTICGYHTTHFMKEGAEALDSVKSRMILRRVGTRWFLQSVTNALANPHFPKKTPVASKDLVTQRAIQERTKK